MNPRFPKYVPAAFILALLVAVCQAAEYYGVLSGINGPIVNWILSRPPIMSDRLASGALLVVEIDNKAWQSCFESHTPMPPTVVSGLIHQVASAHPSVIGVDILTDTTETATAYRKLAPEFDKLGATVVWASDAVVPAGGTARVRGPSFWQWLGGGQDTVVIKPSPVLGFDPGELEQHPEIKWGVPVYSGDEDETIRRFPRTIWVSADPMYSRRREPQHTWARNVAEAYCRGACTPEQDDEIYVKYGGAAPREFRMLDLFTCPGQSKPVQAQHSWQIFSSLANGQIVLIGGTFAASGDVHRTPLGILPGLIVNAYAVKAELRGDGVQDVTQPLALLLDFALGILMMVSFHWKKIEEGRWFHLLARLGGGEKRAHAIVGLALGIGVCIGSRWISGGRYLLGFAGVLLGMVLHLLLELSEREEPAAEMEKRRGAEPQAGVPEESFLHRKITVEETRITSKSKHTDPPSRPQPPQ